MAQHTIAAQDASRASFEASIEAAKRHARETGEDLYDVLDRMDRNDASVVPAIHPLISADKAHLAQRMRGALWIDPTGRRTYTPPARTLGELLA
ncbi:MULTISPECIES: hypothetical protein [Cellulosimicrobium]|uniref:hypothetical protein n=1 Tax=Cellulosimicrobium TaxID=157920 RepID=UPI001BA973D9|nr:hypothetical protein [Cellulosimicrobium cellulans]QUC01879.1 hypothetical protein J5A69_19745 [Cellulosimicrobium cellulans]